MRLLATACTVLVLCACTSSFNRPAASVTPKPSPPPATLAAFLPVAEKFVEDHRGLKYKTPVKVSFLADADFLNELQKANPVDVGGYATESKVLHALALVDDHPDLAKAEKELEGTSVVGFYDLNSKQLYVRGTDARASVRHVLVHELTHALQDQWFDINRTLPDDDESDTAFRTLVEGDAVRIEDEYIASLSPAEQRQVEADNARGGAPPADVPDVLEELDAFPYVVGPRFTREVVSAAGQSRLDAAFKSPPVSTAQVIHSSLFLSGAQPAKVDQPAADGSVIDKGVIGEMGLDLILERMVARGEASDSEARTIATGWSGDRYVAWDQGSQSCVRDRLVMSGRPATSTLLTALHQFAADHPGATVEGTGPVLFTACE
jgi:hypothetical protein